MENIVLHIVRWRQGRGSKFLGTYCLDQSAAMVTTCDRTPGRSPAVPLRRRRRPALFRGGWTLKRCTPPSRVFRGQRPAHRPRRPCVYIAQVTGSQISALDIATGSVDTISPKGSDIVAPDDVAFLGSTLIATEVMNGRVSALENGVSRVLRDDVPSANGITVHNDRLFIGECRHGGRLLELTLDGAAPG